MLTAFLFPLFQLLQRISITLGLFHVTWNILQIMALRWRWSLHAAVVVTHVWHVKGNDFITGIRVTSNIVSLARRSKWSVFFHKDLVGEKTLDFSYCVLISVKFSRPAL